MNEEGGFSLRSVASFGTDVFTSLTIGNPFFTRRIGAAGWDTTQSPWLSKLNPWLAPKAHKARAAIARRLGTTNAAGNALLSKADSAMAAGRHRLASKLKGAAWNIADASRQERMATMAASRPHGVFAWATKMIGEPGYNQLDEHLAKSAATKFGGSSGKFYTGAWTSKLFGKGSSAATRHAAAMYGLGRIATRVNAGMLMYDAARFLFKPVEILAEIGNSARAQVTQTTGPGIREPGMAATMRQQAIMQMQSSDFGPRSVIGNEAQFLHV